MIFDDLKKTKPDTSNLIPVVVDAVAVVGGGGFICESAPTYKPRGGKRMILLTYEQRKDLQYAFGSRNSRDMLFNYDDERYQGQFVGALPQGYMTVDWSFTPRINTWSNAEHQWFVAQNLLEYLVAKVEQRGGADEITNGAYNLLCLVKLAAEQK